MSPRDGVIPSENCSEGPDEGAGEQANRHAWSRRECTYKTVKAPAEHRVEGCRAPSWALLGCLRRCRPQHTLRRGPAARNGRRGWLPRHPPALSGSPHSPRPQAPSHPRPPPASLTARPRPARPGDGGPAVPPAPPPRRSRSSPRRKRAERAGKGWRRSARLLLQGGGPPRSLHQRQVRHPAVCTLPRRGATARPPCGQPACFRPARGHRGPSRGAPRLTSPQPETTPLAWAGATACPAPGPNSSAAPLRSQPLLSPRQPRRPPGAFVSHPGWGATVQPPGPPQTRQTAGLPASRRGGAGVCARSRDRQGAVETPARAGRSGAGRGRGD